MAQFFSKEWADEVRDAIEAGPTEAMRETKLQEYWDFYAFVRGQYEASWALGCRDLPRALGGSPSYLFVQWHDGHVTDCRIVGPDDPLEATFVLEGDFADWAALLTGYDAQRTVMYRKLLLEEGDLLQFFTAIYFFVESIACLATVQAQLAAEEGRPVPA